MKQQGAAEPYQVEVEDMAMDVFERMRLRESTLRHEHDKMHEDKQRQVKLMTRDYAEVWSRSSTQRAWRLRWRVLARDRGGDGVCVCCMPPENLLTDAGAGRQVMAGIEKEADELRVKIKEEAALNAHYLKSLWGKPHDPGHAGKYSPLWLVGQLSKSLDTLAEKQRTLEHKRKEKMDIAKKTISLKLEVQGAKVHSAARTLINLPHHASLQGEEARLRLRLRCAPPQRKKSLSRQALGHRAGARGLDCRRAHREKGFGSAGEGDCRS